MSKLTSAEEICALRRVLDAAVALLGVGSGDGCQFHTHLEEAGELQKAVLLALAFRVQPKRASRRAPPVGHTPELRQVAKFVAQRRDLMRSYGGQSHADAYDIVLTFIAQMGRER